MQGDGGRSSYIIHVSLTAGFCDKEAACEGDNLLEIDGTCRRMALSIEGCDVGWGRATRGKSAAKHARRLEILPGISATQLEILKRVPSKPRKSKFQGAGHLDAHGELAYASHHVSKHSLPVW
eukprot:355388-Amphidinium_carterae.1